MSAARFSIAWRAATIGLAFASLAHAVLASDRERAPNVPLLPAYEQECASCHLAYPPRLLPAASWQRLMTNLPHHFGTDASLDAVTTKTLSNWLVANAGSDRRTRETPPEDRLTRSAWFIGEHDEVSPAIWKRPAVKSAANCAACHPRADQGAFNEHDIRIPR